ncbi:putative SnoaL-like aldol condensation-catalyzing enzyme [Catalinimonas alkaloidigena]|uniref:nuclear transport factor 2 family protein n=1 Tax=Catalinimonas alkaloidigena TaxID=1075417 RepID=UPI002404BCAC|nr:nuclear transport factor 2 family protein [Catalinimonas alkaloidigena]MDF9798697.1 putative SnoaL-like aldol condensation-catalyzing enzyme [Catalinimonas alkaloidigena]
MTTKEIAQDFLQLAAQGASREAFRKYVGQNFKHHNAYFKGDGQTLMLAMEEDARQNPDKIFEIQRALEDGNLVAVHSRISQKPEDLGMAVMHIFRFEEGKIAELWDFGQAVPPNMPNENGMF